MKDSAYKISLDINEHGSQAVLKAKKTDTGRKIYISLRAGGTPYTIAEDCYAVFTATKPDGSILYNACTIENNEIVYEFTEQTCAAVGRNRCEIKLYGLDDKLITSPRFALLVDGTVYPEGRVESTDEFSALTRLVTDAMGAIANANVATEEATQSSQNAAMASVNANEAATAANEAANNASNAMNSANLASQNANAAADSANNASESANIAANNANVATGAANKSANNANEAAVTAREAAHSANDAAEKAAHTAKSLMVVGDARGEVIALDDAIEQYLVGCRIFGKTTQDGTPTPDAPVDLVSVGDSGSIGVTVCGKNLANDIVNGTQSAAYAGALYCKLDGLEPNTEYTVSFVGAYGNKIYANENLFEFKEVLCDGKRQYVTLKTQHNISKDRTDQHNGERWIIFKNYASNTVVPNFKDVQIERGSTATTYEPHKSQNASAPTNNGLPGVPVTSGGNYTDSNGQQWICDEIDYARGVYVQRVGLVSKKISLYNLAAMPIQNGLFQVLDFKVKPFSPVMSNLFKEGYTQNVNHTISTNRGNNDYAYFYYSEYTTTEELISAKGEDTLTITYVLEAPIETPLSEEELAAYAALHTYKDHTTVSNDAGAWMELEYVMDAKKYIDGLFAGTIAPATVE